MSNQVHTFILSDESLNSYGFWVKTDGIDLSEFEKRPVMLYDHDDYKRMPIGKWENIRKEGDKLLADAVFDEDDKDALLVKGKVEKQMLSACSIGFAVKETDQHDSLNKKGQKRATVTKAVLQEVSITPFPANTNAVKLYDEDTKVVCLGEGSNHRLNELVPTLSIKNELNIKNETMEKTLSYLSLSDKASDQDVLSAIKERELKSIDKDQSIALLLSYGQLKGVVTEDNRATYEKLAQSDFNSVKTLFENSTEASKETEELPMRLSEFIQEVKKLNHNSEKQGREAWTLSDWQEKDMEGLLELKEKNLEAYKKLYKDSEINV